MNSEEKKAIGLSGSQWKIKAVNPNTLYALMPRGSGKTFMIGDRVEELSEVMPRSQILLGGDTFARLEERVVPNILNYLINENGLVEGEDFSTFKAPPEHWDTPIIPLKKFDHVISFATGMALCLASQAVPGSANAYNAQAAIFDEAKYMKEEVVNTEFLPALRGAFDLYGSIPQYRSHWYFTDKYGPNIKWLLQKKRLCNQKHVDAVIRLELEVLKMEAIQKNTTSSLTHAKYNAIIEQYKSLQNKVRMDMVYYLDAPAYENIAHLGEKYFRDLRRFLSKYEYSISVENKDPLKAEHSFYPNLNAARNYHVKEHDTDLDKPLIISLDYQWRITPLVASQFSQLPGNEYTTFNVVNAMHTLHPSGGIEKTMDKFCKFYNDHRTKQVYYVYDHTAVGKRPDGNTFADIVKKCLSDGGWNVIDVYMGQAPQHSIKHEQFKTILEKEKEMSVQLNQYRCQPLITSLEGAAAVTSFGKVKKDKRGEKDLRMSAEEQTDYSDAFDQQAYAALVMNLIKPTAIVAMPIATR